MNTMILQATGACYVGSEREPARGLRVLVVRISLINKEEFLSFAITLSVEKISCRTNRIASWKTNSSSKHAEYDLKNGAPCSPRSKKAEKAARLTRLVSNFMEWSVEVADNEPENKRYDGLVQQEDAKCKT